MIPSLAIVAGTVGRALKKEKSDRRGRFIFLQIYFISLVSNLFRFVLVGGVIYVIIYVF